MPHYTPQSGIYIITSTKSQNIYIGKSTNLRERWSCHKTELRGNYHHNRHLQNAWNKYGEKAFKFQVLEYCPADQLNEREIHFIAIYKAKGVLYNLTDGGEGIPGMVVTEETRQKISIGHKGKFVSEETRKRISKSKTGKVLSPLSDEHKQKISQANKGKKRTPEMLERISKSRIGIKLPPHTEETKRKIGDAQKGEKNHNFGKTIPDDVKAKIGLKSKGRKHTEQAKEKIRLAKLGKKRRPLTEDEKKHLSSISKGRVLSDETKQRMSEAQKLRYKKERGEIE